jgi:hypothetical protein
MYNFSVPVDVKAVEPNARILVEWSAYGAPTPIEWIFTSRPDATTFVSVTNKGFPGGDAEAMQHALDATEGFAFVLAGAKALLEHNVAALNDGGQVQVPLGKTALVSLAFRYRCGSFGLIVDDSCNASGTEMNWMARRIQTEQHFVMKR